MTIVAGYARVSSATQVEDGLGLEVQEEAITRWCRDHGHRLEGIFRDEGVSGTVEGAERPGLGAALAMLEDGGADILVVYRLDRLARDLILQETMIERLALAGRSIVSVSEPDIAGNDPTRVLVRQLLGAIAQYERMVITARMKAGRMAKAARGGFAYGSPRFGWRAEHGELVPNPDEQQAVARIAELHRQGRSLREIAAALNEEGHRPKRSERWHPQVVARIVRRFQGPSSSSGASSSPGSGGVVVPFPSPRREADTG